VGRKGRPLYCTLLKIGFLKVPKEDRRACHLHALKEASMVEGLTPIKGGKRRMSSPFYLMLSRARWTLLCK